MSDREEDTRRPRQLTSKGQEWYENTKEDYVSRLEKAWKMLETSLNIELTEHSKHAITDKKTQISKNCECYMSIFEDFKSYLRRQNTHESSQDLNRAQQLCDQRFDLVKQTLTCLDSMQSRIVETIEQENAEVKSQASGRSVAHTHSSASSRLSETLTRMKAKVQAARVNMQFAEKECELKKKCAEMEEEQKLATARNNALIERKRTELEAELNILSHKKLVAATEAECKVIEQETRVYNSELIPENLASRERCSSIHVERIERTAKYLQDMNDRIDGHEPNQIPQFNDSRLDPECQPYVPTTTQTNNPNTSKQVNITNGSLATDLTRFLLKKDLLLSRLTNFNDQPETFLSWKSSFLSIMRDLDVNPCEEIDLLVKYLGQESSKYALNIRSANCNNPTIGLARLWDRLDERYGRPELIDASLRLKIDNFPKLTNRETKRLYELSDILSEIEAIKENPRFQQTFAFYDSSSGILPIIRKLPQPLQDKWTTHAVRYKDEHNVSFPPFSCFVAFIRKMSRIKNDPSFHYESSQSNELSFRDSKIPRRFVNDNKTKIHSNKTDFKSSFDSKEVEFSCPFHRSSKHNISECRGFKVQSIEERRKFLKENGICFLCCESSRHKKKDCNKAVTCNDCGSTSHSSALHVDSESIPSKNYGGEQSSTGRDHITNKCTQVCSKPFNGKSCSKTVLVKVYKKGNPAGALRVYAILDEQSNRSLASTSLFNVLDIRGQPSEYHLTSCAGTIKSSGRRASNIVIESLDGQSTIEVPTLVECELPNIRDEIPTPAVVRYHPHLSHIASEIPEIDNEAQILLLIGRDVPEAHHIHRPVKL